jgi:hypothetical protein
MLTRTQKSHRASIDFSAVASSLTGFEPPNLHLLDAYDLDLANLKEWLIYISKLLFILYLAACLWNILSAVRDGILHALQPVITLWSLVRWVLGRP